ncbi:MAG: hypothetical protein U0Z44_10175 [Kouleothrix sp.]
MRRSMLVFILLLAACGTPAVSTPPATLPAAATAVASSNDPCSAADLQAYRAKYDNVIDRWGDEVIVAGRAKAAELQGPIDALQRLANELAAVQPPACAQQAHGESLEAMKLSIGGYQNLMAAKEVGTTLRQAIDQLSFARIKIAALPGTPVPTATLLPTLTPLPTAAPTATAVPTATPLPRKGVIAASRTQVYETSTSDTPIKTLLRNTPVLAFEVHKGRLHIRAGQIDGWVSQSAVVIR